MTRRLGNIATAFGWSSLLNVASGLVRLNSGPGGLPSAEARAPRSLADGIGNGAWPLEAKTSRGAGFRLGLPRSWQRISSRVLMELPAGSQPHFMRQSRELNRAVCRQRVG
jgi:hypothetical protein